MKTYAISLGILEKDIITRFSDGEVSTRGESIANLDLLKEHGLKKFILVTSAYHTQRSYLTYTQTINSLGYDATFIVYPAPDPDIPIDGWWKIRTGQKGVFFEYIKLLAYQFN